MLTRKGRATRNRIVAAAADLMFERGASGTTLEDVRERAGVSFSQLYHYFADKMALVHAVVDFRTNAIVDEGQPVLDSMVALQQWRTALIALQRESACRGGCPLRALSSELAEVSDDTRTMIAHSFERWRAAIEAGLARMQARGELRPEVDTTRLATATLAAVQGGLVITQAERTTDALDAALEMALAHIASHLKRTPRSTRVATTA